jgi:hypothetical protein
MQKTINNFCLGGLRVAAARLYADPAKGGLGLINIRDSLMAQHVIWIKRAFISTRDNWRWDLWNLGHGNCLTLPVLCHVEHPILATFADSYREF